MVGGRRWLVAKGVNERAPTQHPGEGQRVPERLSASYRCPQLIERPIRVTEHPGDQHREDVALRGGMETRPIGKLYVRIEQLEAPPKVRKRRLELPLVVHRVAQRHVRPDETGRFVKPFGHTQRLLGKMLRLLHLE